MQRSEVERACEVFRRSYLRELGDLPCDPTALRTLIDSIPRRARGLNQSTRIMLAERLRDKADEIEFNVR